MNEIEADSDNLDEAFMDALLDDFLDEAREHVESVDRDLVTLETQTPDPDPELIAKIFRCIHSVKGASGFLGFTGIIELSHRMETLFHLVRKGDLRPDTEIINVLLAANDILKNMLDDIQMSDQIDISEISAQISRLIDSACNAKTRKQMTSSVRLTDMAGNDIDFTVSEFKLENIPDENAYLYLLTLNLHEVEKEKGIKSLALIRSLLAKGMLVDTKIETRAFNFDEDFSDMPLMYLALYATHLEIDAIRAIIDMEPHEIVKVRRDPVTTRPSEPLQPQEESAKRPDETAALPDPVLANEVSEKQHPETGAPPDQGNIRETHEQPDTVRIRVPILDRLMKLTGEMVLIRNNLLAMTKSNPAFRNIAQQMNIVTTELQGTIMQSRLQPIGNLFSRLPRIVRDIAAKLGKQIEIEITGSDVELDKTIIENLNDPLIHLIRNACDHGIEPPDIRQNLKKPVVGRINIHAFHEAGQIHILIHDDGKGLDPDTIRTKAIQTGLKTEDELSAMNTRDILNIVLSPGFSTAAEISEVSGRGVGMDVVKSNLEKIGGSLEIESRVAEGTRISLKIPLTLAIIPCLIVKVDNYRYAIPQANVKEAICLYNEEVYTKVEYAGDQEVIRLRDRLLPIVRLNEVLKRPKPFTAQTRYTIAERYAGIAQTVIAGGEQKGKMLNFIVIKMGTKRYGLVVDQVFGVEEIVVNPMPKPLEVLNIYFGTTVMGDGSVALILDTEGLAGHAAVRFNLDDPKTCEALVAEDKQQTVLLFKYGPQEQFAVPLPMIRRLEPVETSAIEKVGDREFIAIAGVSTLVLRLNNYLNISPCPIRGKMLLLLPKHIRRPFGILASEAIDLAKADLDLNVESHMQDGLLGTSIIRDRMTLFPDFYRLIELAEPDWFDDRKIKAPPPKQQKRVLLVEDMAFFRNLVAGYLEDEGYQVTKAQNGNIAAAILANKKFDIIISDLEMPVMDGWTFMQHIRKESTVPNIPSIALTSLDSDKDRNHAKNAGFDAYQVKLDREALLINVSELLNK